MSRIARFGAGAKPAGGGATIPRPTTGGVTSPRAIPGGGATRTVGAGGVARATQGGGASGRTTTGTNTTNTAPSRLATPTVGSAPRTNQTGRNHPPQRSSTPRALSPRPTAGAAGGAKNPNAKSVKASSEKAKGAGCRTAKQNGVEEDTPETRAAKTAESVKIYTDWANHYLEKARNKRVITDLQVDICDGVILAEVIEAVTNERVRDIKTKPRNSQQMVENIGQCLTFLAGLGVNVEGLSAKDIKDGNLKAILGLFFSLSRFKQQQKSAQQQVQHNINQNTVTPTSDSGRSSTGSASNANANTEMLSRLPSPFSSKGNSKCPTVTHPGVTKDPAPSNHNLNKNRTPASAAAAVAADRVRSPAPQNNNNPPGGSSSIPSKATSRESVSTSRSTSPSSSASNIPTPGGRSGLRAPGTISEKHAAAASGRLVSSTSTSSCASTASGASSSTKSSGTNPAAATKAGLGAGANNKNSMLDKFKFFKGDKKSGVPKSSSSKKGSSADKDAEKSQQQAGASAVAEAKGGVGTSSRIASPKTEPNGASGGGGSPKLAAKSSTKKSSFGLKKKDTSVSKDDLNSKRGIPNSTSANLQSGPLTVNGTGSSSGAKRSSGSSKAEKAEAATTKGSSSSSSNTNQNGGQSGQSSPQTSRKTSKIASLAGKSSSKSSKNAASNSNLSGAAAPVGSGIPAPSTGIPKPGSRSSSKPPKEDSKAKVPTSSSSSKEKGFQHSGPPPAVAQHAQLKVASRSESGRSESPKPPPRTTSVLSSTLEQPHSSQNEMERSDASLRRAAKNSNQVQLDELARVQKHVKAAAMAAARSQSPSGDAAPTRSSSSSSTTHSSQRTPSASSATAGAEHHDPRKASSGTGSRPKPVKVDSDTQTHASAVAVAHARMREVGKEKSSQSLSSDGSGSANVSSGENSKSSTSNSNNSVSSNDSVIFRPSSCDELESGMESDGGGSLSTKATDHISNLRKHNGGNTMNSNCSSPGSPAGVRRGDTRDIAATKMETTFDTEGHAETRDVEHKPSRETTFGDEQEDIIDIKPMMPITRSSPYAYLKSMAPGTLPRPSFHMSSQLTPGANSASSRLGVNRPLIDPHSYSQLKRTVSNGHHNMDVELSAHNLDGYMSDGDVLHSTLHHPSDENSGYFSDVNSGYMSEGGASIYAKKMQQRFREGMAAVKECMQKSAGLPDEDRYVRHGLQYPIEHSGFDDSSSISSGEISDTINEISTDENLTGSSLSAGSEHTNNPYGGSLRRAPQTHNPFSHQNKFGLLKSGNGLLDRNLHHGGSSRETGDFSLRKYFIGGDRLPSDARSDGSLERSHWGMDRNSGPHPIYRTIDIPPSGSLLRKGSQGTVTDPRTGQQWQPGTAYAVEDPSLKNTYAEPCGGSGGSGKGEKKDSETNTDHTLMLRKGQAGRPPQGGFALRRPLSNVSTGSTGSSKSGGSIHGPQIGMKLTEKEKAQQKGERLANYTGAIRPVQKTASGTQTGYHHTSRSESSTDMGPEAYSESTLERKKRSASLVTSKSQSTVSVNAGQAPAPGGPDDYRSSTLGRKRPDMAIRDRLFGSRSSLNGKPPVAPEGAQNTVNGTIISNPHATYSKQESSPYRHNTYSGSMSTSSTSPVGASPYVNVNYAQSDYMNNRPSSAMSNPTSPSNSPWIKSAPASLHNGAMRGTLSETESMESISSSASSSIQAQIQQARAHGLLSRSILQHEKDIQTGHIQRSDSFRSTQSEKMFPSASQPDGLQRTNSFSQITGHPPPSPTPSNSSHASSRYTYPGMTPMSPTSGGMSLIHATSTNSQSVPYGLGLPLSKINSKDEDLHGSALSLVSSSSSVYSTADERAAAEILKLRRELESAQEKVTALTTQLAPNIHIPGHHHHGQQQNALTAYSLSQRAHVVAAFEQSLSNMTTRLQQLTSTAEQKDSELNDLRATIEALKQQSGIQFSPEHTQFSPGSHRRPSSSNTSTLSREPSTPGEPPRISRHMSSDSMSSINSLSSACSATSQQSSATDTDSAKKKKKGKSWVLRSSFSKAFSRKKNKHGSVSDVEPDTASMRSDCSVPNSPLLHPHNTSGSTQNNSSMKGSHSSHALCDVDQDKAVMQLQVALHEKDMKLTDIRLEALSSAHQLEQLRETMNRMKNEMASLKADNSRLQQLVCKKGLTHPQPMAANPTSPSALEKRLSLEAPSNLDIVLSDNADREGRRITISVSLTNEVSKLTEGRPGEVLVGAISVSGKTKWEMLDVIVRRVFKEYVLRIDPVTNLGLTTESVNYYSIGDLLRAKDVSLPELLPCGYLVGDHTNITLTLKGTAEHSVESLAFETLIPKSIVQRYISLLLEHRRIILCGPSGTGKSYLAQKLAEYLVLKAGKELTAGLIATFNVDHKSSKELRQYLANIADQCESTTAGELPSVIILDNLHHVTSLGEVFNGFLSVKYQKCPYIIGTMNQATCSTTNLQLHHNFRWVLCANHMEPVKGFLGRYLRRKLIEAEIQTRARNNDLAKIADWMPKVWQHLNKFLETHSSSDVTIGPRLFLSCPMDVPGSQVWFTDLWNYSIVPYLLEAVREGLQAYGRRAPWEDPADWVIETYPWPHSNDQDWPSLLRLRPEDVGYDSLGPTPKSEKAQGQGAQQSDSEGDPLLNMLMRLQEAASYSSPQSADSDSTSLDSHSSGVQEFTSNSTESTL